MFDETLEPIDTCGCGDIGYLTTRTIPIDLAHGVGKIHQVPVYHCRSTSCHAFTIPSLVSRRLDEFAEEMEMAQTLEMDYSWEPQHQNQEQSLDPIQRSSEQLPIVQAFTLQFANREYEDTRVLLVVAGQAVIFQSTVEASEYYLLRYEPEIRSTGTWFSFHKFYYEEPEFIYEDFLVWSEDGHLKELGVLALEEVEEALTDEFGEWV